MFNPEKFNIEENLVKMMDEIVSQIGREAKMAIAKINPNGDMEIVSNIEDMTKEVLDNIVGEAKAFFNGVTNNHHDCDNCDDDSCIVKMKTSGQENDNDEENNHENSSTQSKPTYRGITGKPITEEIRGLGKFYSVTVGVMIDSHETDDKFAKLEGVERVIYRDVLPLYTTPTTKVFNPKLILHNIEGSMDTLRHSIEKAIIENAVVKGKLSKQDYDNYLFSTRYVESTFELADYKTEGEYAIYDCVGSFQLMSPHPNNPKILDTQDIHYKVIVDECNLIN